MPTNRWTILVTLLAVAHVVPTLAIAQGGPTSQPGEEVQVRIVGPSTAPIRLRCAGSVATVAGDTVVLGQSGDCSGGSPEADLRIARGYAGSRLSHTALGLVGGAIVGGIVGRISAGDGCVIEGCDDGDLVVRIKTVIGAAVGAVAGAVIGAALPAGPRRLNATTRWPLRVAGLEVRPELRLSLDDRRGH